MGRAHSSISGNVKEKGEFVTRSFYLYIHDKGGQPPLMSDPYVPHISVLTYVSVRSCLEKFKADLYV